MGNLLLVILPAEGVWLMISTGTFLARLLCIPVILSHSSCISDLFTSTQESGLSAPVEDSSNY